MELSTKTPRIEVVDALRGFAVMAILLVHNLEHFIFPVYPENSPEWLTILEDRKSTRLNSSHIEESRMPSSA